MSDVRECAALQLSEIEMLESMFPDSNEFSLNSDVLREIKRFVNGSDFMPSRVEYSVNLTTEKGKISLHAALPSCYPSEPPDVYVRSDQLSRHQQRELNLKLNEFLETVGKGELVIGSAILWLQENAESFLSEETCDAKEVEEKTCKDSTYSRAWIYSHHIYSKVKRKDIRDLAEEYNLTGFCLPGKPGIICVEGISSSVNEWWHTVRSWNWQKILCKRIEQEKIHSADTSLFQRFSDFQELGTSTNIRVKSSGFHVDMGDLFRYLEDHDSGYMFEEFFGVAGK